MVLDPVITKHDGALEGDVASITPGSLPFQAPEEVRYQFFNMGVGGVERDTPAGLHHLPFP